MNWQFWKRGDRQTMIANELLDKDFLRTVKHYVCFPNSASPFSLAILPLHDGVLTSISRENFSTATDESGRLIFTALDKGLQLIIDYETGLMTVAMGYVLYDTYEIPEQPKHQQHDIYH